MGFGSLTFLNPWALAALGLLPFVWMMLKFLPPAPKRVAFPPVRLLAELTGDDASADQTPPWLVALRLTILALLIAASAHPVQHAEDALPGDGPLILIIDNDWAAAPQWAERQRVLLHWAARAERENRTVIVVATAARRSPSDTLDRMSPATARDRIQALTPRPWSTDRTAAAARLGALGISASSPVLWVSNGLAEAGGDDATDDWIYTLRRLGPLTVVTDRSALPPMILRPSRSASGLAVTAHRADGGPERTDHVLTLDGGGETLARTAIIFDTGARQAQAAIELPAELRERASLLRLETTPTAASVVMLDDRWRRRAVGLVTPADDASPLLGPRHYLSQALAPLAEVRVGGVKDLLQRPLGVLMLADPPPMDDADQRRLADWMAGGGVLVRFAGPRLAEHPDGLTPVPLRTATRALGGALSWAKPVRLGAFNPSGPFKGLTPPSDVTVRRQVLADPSPEQGAHTWASLADGTPLVTAAGRGDGWLVLVHTTASPAWSNLVWSGVFLDMTERLIGLGRGGAAAADGDAVLPPHDVLDGFGRLGGPRDGVSGLVAATIDTIHPGPRHPPGLYGDGATARALNLGVRLPAPPMLGDLPEGVASRSFDGAAERDHRPLALAAALLLALLDLMATLYLRGGLSFSSLKRPSRAVGLLIIVIAGGDAGAADVPAASLQTRLAHVKTGDAATDRLVAAGLVGLGVIVNRRTSAELGAPVAVDVRHDALSFYPLLYWPLTAGAAAPDDAVAARLAAYLEKGGVVLFDGGLTGHKGATRDALRTLAQALRLPALAPIPTNHVLGRSFYLLHQFPGRWADGAVWVERPDDRINDGVSAVIAGNNGWAAAWAMDETQRFTTPVVPGGEGQREQALRFGINLVMYVLTGNYKADQVHVPAILKRLGK